METIKLNETQEERQERKLVEKEMHKDTKENILNTGKDDLIPKKVTCFNCGKVVLEKSAHRWYHGDQDDLVCTECARKLKHTCTAYSGLPVLESVGGVSL